MGSIDLETNYRFYIAAHSTAPDPPGVFITRAPIHYTAQDSHWENGDTALVLYSGNKND
jgi:hypothetical protein